MNRKVFAAVDTALTLSNGAHASYVSGSGSKTLVFTYESTSLPGPLSTTGIYSGGLTNSAGNYVIPKGASVTTYPLTVIDTAANIASNLAALTAHKWVTSITVSDPTDPIVITNVQLKGGNRAINEIQGPYALKVTGINGQPFVSYLKIFDSSGSLTDQTDYKSSGTVYLTFSQSVTGDVTTDHYTSGSYFNGKQFGSEDVLFNPTGGKIEEVLYNLDGTHTIDGMANDLTISSIGNDTITGGGSGETFVMAAGFGHDTITDLGTYRGNAAPDTVSFATSEFANFDAMFAATVNTPKGARITSTGGDVLTLTGVTKSMVTANSASFLFTPG